MSLLTFYCFETSLAHVQHSSHGGYLSTTKSTQHCMKFHHMDATIQSMDFGNEDNWLTKFVLGFFVIHLSSTSF